MLIDKKGRLFGKVNIIDLGVILFLISLLPFGYYWWKIKTLPQAKPAETMCMLTQSEYAQEQKEIKARYEEIIARQEKEYKKLQAQKKKLETQRDMLFKEHKRLRRDY